VLADLLMDADEKQFAALFPPLKKQGERAAAPLLAELDRQAPFRWDDRPLDPAWPTPQPAAVRQLEAARGLVAERFALCQTLPPEEFVSAAEALRPAGYRPIRVRPFGHRSGAPVLVAALWARDGRDWRLWPGLSAADAAVADAEQQKQGYRPADVAGYFVAGAERYAVLWVRGDDTEDARLYAGAADRDHRATSEALRRQEFQPATLHVLVLPGGEVRFSGVWRKPAPVGTARWDDSERAYADQLALDLELPIDVALSFSDGPLPAVGREADPRRRFASVWQVDARRECADVPGLDPAAHLERCRELAARGYRPAALAVAEERAGQALRTASVWHRPLVAPAERERLAKRQASAAVALVRLGRGERVWPLLEHSPDPRVRSYLMHRLNPLGADPEALVRRLDEEPDVTVRRALLLALGQFGEGELPAARREALLPRLFALYRNDPDAGIHGSAAWLLGQWGQRPRLQEIDRDLAGRDRETAREGRLPAGGRRWYVNGQGQTMVVVPGSSPFWMGSPRTEQERESGPENRGEQRHRKLIGMTYALAAHEVTVAQFRKFQAGHDYNKTFSPTPEHPVNAVTSYQAAGYCNWLSQQEDIPPDQWCYEINPAAQDGRRVRMRPNYLSLSGYRLPSEAEWECACRAGATTARHYGETDELLGRYACYTKTSGGRAALPVGSLEPNDLGLFDMLGNVLEWCQEQVLDYGHPSDTEDMRDILDTNTRSLRGGASTSPAWAVRSSYRNAAQPANRTGVVGLRPARTLPTGAPR
jgi:formylglycine-generating enzyme required for sulfatase activity